MEWEATIPTLWNTVKGVWHHRQNESHLTHKQNSSSTTLNTWARITPWDTSRAITANRIIFATVSQGSSWFYPSKLMAKLQTGVILRLPIWTSGEGKHIKSFLNFLSQREDFIMRQVQSWFIAPFLVVKLPIKRWGDAPVHSIAVSLFARKEQVHFFKDIGYKHEWFQHCPSGDTWAKGRCACDPKDTFGMWCLGCHFVLKLISHLQRLSTQFLS